MVVVEPLLMDARAPPTSAYGRPRCPGRHGRGGSRGSSRVERRSGKEVVVVIIVVVQG